MFGTHNRNIRAISARFGIEFETAKMAYENPEFRFEYRGIVGTLADQLWNDEFVWSKFDHFDSTPLELV